MGIQIKGGMTLRGLSIKGQEFLSPLDIVTCLMWYKWKTGITLDASNNVQQWDDQSIWLNHMSQATNTRRPAYDAATGKITPDGSNDYLTTGFLQEHPVYSEYTFVSEFRAGLDNRIISRVRHSTADAELLNFAHLDYFFKFVPAGNGAYNTSVSVNAINEKCVWSAIRGQFFKNGVAVPMIKKSTALWNDLNFTINRVLIGASGRNSGSLPATPSVYYGTPVYDICMHDHELLPLERIKLHNYFKAIHGIV